MRYRIGFRLSARYIAEVEANSLKEAKEIANEQYENADFGEAEDIDGEIKFVEDKNGNRIEDC